MGFFTKLFGNKAMRDNKALQPILDKTLAAYETIKTLDIDALRNYCLRHLDKLLKKYHLVFLLKLHRVLSLHGYDM